MCPISAPDIAETSRFTAAGTATDAVVGHENKAQNDAYKTHEIDRKAQSPADICEHTGKQGCDHAAELVGRRGQPHEPLTPLRREVIGQKPRGQRHDDADTDTDERTHDKHRPNRIEQSRSRTADGVQHKAEHRKRPCAEALGKLAEKQVRYDDKQRRHGDNKLNFKLARLGKMLSYDLQCGCDRRTCHDRQQRKRKYARRQRLEPDFSIH